MDVCIIKGNLTFGDSEDVEGECVEGMPVGLLLFTWMKNLTLMSVRPAMLMICLQWEANMNSVHTKLSFRANLLVLNANHRLLQVTSQPNLQRLFPQQSRPL